MMFKNSIKLFVANFSIFWKVLLYKLIVVLVGVLLFLPVLNIWVEAFQAVNFLDAFTHFATNTVFVNLTELFRNLFVLVQTFIDGIYILLQTSVFSFIYSLFLAIIVIPFLYNLSSIPAGECLYSYMATLSKPKFTIAFINRIGISSVYSIFKTLMLIPILAIFLSGFYGLLMLTTIEGILQIFLPLIIFIYIVVVVAVVITFFSGWMPASVVFNISPVLTYKKGIKAVFRRFFKILSTMLIIIFLSTFMTLMFTSISLVVVIPFTEVMIIMFEMVMFFESQGNRYYVDMDTICCPKKLEECDSFKKVKSII